MDHDVAVPFVEHAQDLFGFLVVGHARVKADREPALRLAQLVVPANQAGHGMGHFRQAAAAPVNGHSSNIAMRPKLFECFAIIIGAQNGRLFQISFSHQGDSNVAAFAKYLVHKLLLRVMVGTPALGQQFFPLLRVMTVKWQDRLGNVETVKV